MNKKYLIFILISFSLLFFNNYPGVNHLSRLDVIFNFVEPSKTQYSFEISRFIHNTPDWSYFEGTYYSNKAPLPSLIGILIYFPIYHLEKFFGFHHQHLLNLNIYLINFFVSILPLSISSIFLYKLFRSKFSDKKSTILTLITYLATPLLPYATGLWGHTTATGFLIISIYYMSKENNKNFAFYAGLSCLSDYLLIPTIFILTIINIIKSKDIYNHTIGYLIPVIIYFSYNYICFKNIFSLPQQYSNPIYVENSGIYGMLGKFELSNLIMILFSESRGILFQVPIFIISILGIFKLEKINFLRFISIIGIVVSLILNSSFNGWHGGLTVCARYLIVTIPFFIILLSEVELNGIKKYVTIIFTIISFINMTIITFANPLNAYSIYPLLDSYVKVLSGDFIQSREITLDNTHLITSGNLFINLGNLTSVIIFILLVLLSTRILTRDTD